MPHEHLFHAAFALFVFCSGAVPLYGNHSQKNEIQLTFSQSSQRVELHFFLNEHLFLHAETAGFPTVFSLDKLLKPTKNFLECYIIPETVSTKLETEFTAFCMVFFAFLLFEPIVALAPAITDPTAIATPRPFIIFCVFFFIFLSPHKKISRALRNNSICKRDLCIVLK